MSRRYLAALRAHLGKQSSGNVNRAQELGRAVLAGGFVTLDLAIMHEKAVVALAASHDFDNRRNGSMKRAGAFFTQALIPLEAAQRATRETISHLHQRHEMLRRHTAALAAANRRLEREVARRKAGELTIRDGMEHYRKLLVESQVMQRKLRQLTHQIISAQEEERKEISRELHDEVVQTLVGINVELTALTKGTSAGLHVLKAKIDRTQRFDSIADNRGLEKIKTIGDSYMAAAGLPIPVADHATRAAHMALDMIEVMDRFNEQSPYKLRVRIGMSTGSAVAGVIGKRKFLYDLWGDVVNTASRMESHGVSGRIQVTSSTRHQLGESFTFEERGAIDVKGKGEMHTWFLNGRNGQTNSMPPVPERQLALA